MKKIKVISHRNYTMLLKLLQPYVTHIVHDNDNRDNFSKSFVSYNNQVYEISTIELDKVKSKQFCDILIVDDTFVEFYNDGLLSNIEYKKAVGFFTNGEAYQITDNLKSYLKNPKNYLISSWIRSDIEPGQFELDVFDKPNFIESTFASFYTIITREEHNFLKSLTPYRDKIKKEYDVSFYSRYGYKPWRDFFTDLIREFSKKNGLKLKEINNFKHYETGKKIKVEGENFITDYIGMLIKGNTHVHYDYFADMFDSKFHLVYETSQEESTVFITEKTIKELLFGMPCYIVGSITIRDFLKKLGFFTLDMLEFDESKIYDSILESEDLIKYGNKKTHVIEKIKFEQFLTNLQEVGLNEMIKKYSDNFDNNSKLLKYYLNEENEYRTELINYIL